MKANAFVSAVNNSMEKIGDAIRDALPEGACYALFTTDGEGEQAAMVANIPRVAIVALVEQWQHNYVRIDDVQDNSAGGGDDRRERLGGGEENPADRGGDAVDGSVRGEAPGGGGEDLQAAAVGAGVRDLPPGSVLTGPLAAALLWRANQVRTCVDYIALMEDCFGTALAALTRENRTEFEELMAKVRDHMARAPALMDAMLKAGVRLHRQPHLDALAELPPRFAPGSTTQH